MIERFDDRARRVVVLAQEEARLLKHSYIGTEHILLSLIREDEGVAARSLTSLGIDLSPVRASVTEIIGQGAKEPSGHIPFTPRAKKVIELSVREALWFGHGYVGTEHILLGIVREGEGVASQVLRKLGVEFSTVRRTVAQLTGIEPATDEVPPGPFTDETGPPEAQVPVQWSPSRRPQQMSGFEGLVRMYEAPLVVFSLLAVLLMLVTMIAVLIDLPPAGLASAGLITLLAGVIVTALSGVTHLLARVRPAGLDHLVRGSAVIALVLLASGAVLLGLDALLA